MCDIKEESIGSNHCEAREGGRGAQNVSKLKTHFCPVCVCVVLLLTQLFYL